MRDTKPCWVCASLDPTYEDAIIGIEYYDAPSKIYSQYVLERVSRFSDDQIVYEQEGQNDLQFVVKGSPALTALRHHGRPNAMIDSGH